MSSDTIFSVPPWADAGLVEAASASRQTEAMDAEARMLRSKKASPELFARH
jgi:hypothetical protein